MSDNNDNQQEGINPLIVVSDKEWAYAIAYFKKNPKEVKLRRKHTDKPSNQDEALPEHSFIKVNGEIYVMANKQAAGRRLGEGNFGIVKMVQTKNGENFAIKVEGRGPRGKNDAEIKVMKLINYFKGEVVRKTTGTFKRKKISQKLYTVTKLIKGGELSKGIYVNGNVTKRKELPHSQRLLIALKSCEAIKCLHDKRIIHADIKPENFMAELNDVNKEQITIESVDYGFSLILGSKKNSIKLNSANGTPPYIAPEIKKEHIYSFASDIYALGKLLKADLLFDEVNSPLSILIAKMLDDDAKKRPTIDEVMKVLYVEKYGAVKSVLESEKSILETINLLGEYQNSVLKEIKSTTKPHNSGPLLLSKFDKKIVLADKLTTVLMDGSLTEKEKLEYLIKSQKEIKSGRFPFQKPDPLEKIVDNVIIQLRNMDPEIKDKKTRAAR